VSNEVRVGNGLYDRGGYGPKVLRACSDQRHDLRFRSHLSLPEVCAGDGGEVHTVGQLALDQQMCQPLSLSSMAFKAMYSKITIRSLWASRFSAHYRPRPIPPAVPGGVRGTGTIVFERDQHGMAESVRDRLWANGRARLLQVVDHVPAIVRVRQAWHHHVGARDDGLWIGEERVEHRSRPHEPALGAGFDHGG